jgi:hypothetical protein
LVLLEYAHIDSFSSVFVGAGDGVARQGTGECMMLINSSMYATVPLPFFSGISIHFAYMQPPTEIAYCYFNPYMKIYWRCAARTHHIIFAGLTKGIYEKVTNL